MHQLIINADDCGMQRAFNNAILEAHRNGVLSSTSVCATGPAVEDACARIFPVCPELGTGIHLCLTVGRGLTAGRNPHSGLFVDDGFFRPCLRGYVWYRTRFRPGAALRQAVKDELRAQIEALLPRLTLDHADSHHHVHMIPWIFTIVCDLCHEYKIPFVRFTDEPVSLAALRRGRPGLLLAAHYANMRLMSRQNRRLLPPGGTPRRNTAFCGLLHSGKMRAEDITGFLAENPEAEIAEILLHPARRDAASENAAYMSDEMRATVNQPERERELAALLAPEVKTAIARSGFHLTNYRNLSRSLQNGTREI